MLCISCRAAYSIHFQCAALCKKSRCKLPGTSSLVHECAHDLRCQLPRQQHLRVIAGAGEAARAVQDDAAWQGWLRVRHHPNEASSKSEVCAAAARCQSAFCSMLFSLSEVTSWSCTSFAANASCPAQPPSVAALCRSGSSRWKRWELTIAC